MDNLYLEWTRQWSGYGKARTLLIVPKQNISLQLDGIKDLGLKSTFMELCRVLLQEGGWTWRYRNEHCEKQGKKNMRCYMLPLSKCTLRDAMGIMTAEHKHANQHNSHAHDSHNTEHPEPNNHHAPNKTHLGLRPVTEWTEQEDKILFDAVVLHGRKGHWSIISSLLEHKTDLQFYERWYQVTEPKIRQRKNNPSYISKVYDQDDPNIVDYISNHKVVAINRVTSMSTANTSTATNQIVLSIKHQDTIRDDVVMIDDELISLKFAKYIPTVLHDLAYCAGLQKGFEYMWWRAIGITFVLRPNPETLALIEQHRDPALKAAEGNCISTYVRHGDKTLREMKFVGWDQYASAAMTAFNNKQHAAGGASDVKKVMFVATEDPLVIPAAKKWGQNNGVDVRISGLMVQILGDNKGTVKPHQLEQSLPPHRKWEYLSYLVHLAEEVLAPFLMAQRMKVVLNTEKETDLEL
eukprot:gene22323-28442_t